jgi:hypothetical protein
MLGHESAKITLDVYAGLFDQQLSDVAARMDSLIAGSADWFDPGRTHHQTPLFLTRVAGNGGFFAALPGAGRSVGP